jgi:hypothetical protein
VGQWIEALATVTLKSSSASSAKDKDGGVQTVDVLLRTFVR